MNRDPFEVRLQKLRPAPIPDALLERLAAAKPVSRKIHWLAFALPFTAAAAVILLGFLFREPQTLARSSLQPSDFRVFLPVEARSELLDVRDLGVIETAGLPMRLMHCTWLDDITYRDSDASTLRRASQREQIIPITLETY